MSDTGRPDQPGQGFGAGGPARRPAATPQTGPAPVVGEPEPQETVDTPGRPAWLLPVAIGVGVLVVVAVLVLVLVNRGGDDEPSQTASTVVLPPPTPAVEPAARPATTAFAAALPTSVLQYALESSQDDAERLAAGALEAYTETFTDGSGATVTVRAAQLETAQEASDLLASLTGQIAPAATAPDVTATAPPAETDLPQSGDVVVGGETVGTFTVVDAGDGTGVALWQNGTAVLQVTAPVADVLDVYAAFGL